MFKKAAILSFAVISFLTTPAYADGTFSRTTLKINNTNISVNGPGTILTKTEASTGKWLGEQKFKRFYGMMWIPEKNVLFVSGVLEGSRDIPVLVKITGTGGGGQNMFAIQPDGRSVGGYKYRQGSQIMQVTSMTYNGNLEVFNGARTTYRIRGIGGTGDNMFALTREGSYEKGCASVNGYNYFIECVIK